MDPILNDGDGASDEAGDNNFFEEVESLRNTLHNVYNVTAKHWDLTGGDLRVNSFCREVVTFLETKGSHFLIQTNTNVQDFEDALSQIDELRTLFLHVQLQMSSANILNADCYSLQTLVRTLNEIMTKCPPLHLEPPDNLTLDSDGASAAEGEESTVRQNTPNETESSNEPETSRQGMSNLEQEHGSPLQFSKRSFDQIQTGSSNVYDDNFLASPKKFRSDGEEEEEEADNNYFHARMLAKKEYDQIPVEHQILATDLVMLKILNHFPDSQVRSFRSVNRRFKCLANDVIRHRRCHEISFMYDWDAKCYILEVFMDCDPAIKYAYSLEKYTKFLQTINADEIPWKNFLFLGGTLASRDLQEFFDTHGSNIHFLVLDIYSPPKKSTFSFRKENIPSLILLQILLVNQLPNLKVLGLFEVPPQWDDYIRFNYNELEESESDTESVPEDSLENTKYCYVDQTEFQITNQLDLESLTMSNTAPQWIYRKIIRNSPHLELITSNENIIPALQEKKFHLLNGIMWYPTIENIQLFKEIPTDTTSKLRFLLFCLNGIEDPTQLNSISNILMNILRACTTTLQEFDIYSGLRALPNIILPQLPQVFILSIGQFYIHETPSMTDFPYFPRGFQFTTTFPKLHTVKFDFDLLPAVARWENYFGKKYEPVSSVKRVLFASKRYLPNEWCKQIGKLFPNVEVLQFNSNHFHFYDCSKYLWQMTKLKHLKFRVDINQEDINYPAFDSAFTGISENNCLQLLDAGEDVDMGVVEHLRKYPSILNLKELESLQLVFVDLTEDAIMEYPPILTNITGRFAFQLMKGLKCAFAFRCWKKTGNIKRLKTELAPMYEYFQRIKSFNLFEG